jgi:hypothetical protein
MGSNLSECRAVFEVLMVLRSLGLRCSRCAMSIDIFSCELVRELLINQQGMIKTGRYTRAERAPRRRIVNIIREPRQFELGFGVRPQFHAFCVSSLCTSPATARTDTSGRTTDLSRRACCSASSAWSDSHVAVALNDSTKLCMDHTSRCRCMAASSAGELLPHIVQTSSLSVFRNVHAMQFQGILQPHYGHFMFNPYL